MRTKTRLCPRSLARVVAAALFMSGLAGTAQADDVGALINQLADTETLRGEFRQSTLDSSETRIQSQRGEFKLARPDRLYWYTQPPYEQAIYVNNDTIWLYEADLEQATRQPVTDQWEQSPALILTGTEEQLGRRYHVEQTRNDEQGQRYELTPRATDGTITSMTVSFQGHYPVSIRLVDSFNQTTLVSFENVELNPELDDSVFEFDPPEGVDVIEQMGQ